jgi:uncharacterized protein
VPGMNRKLGADRCWFPEGVPGYSTCHAIQGGRRRRASLEPGRPCQGVLALNDTAALDRYRYLSLATFRKNGAEVKTPVWFAAADGKLYVFTSGESGKVKRLRSSSRVRIAPSDARGRARGLWRDATARIVTEPASIERARVALRAKYGWQMWLTDLVSRLAGRLQRRAWIEVEV